MGKDRWRFIHRAVSSGVFRFSFVTVIAVLLSRLLAGSGNTPRDVILFGILVAGSLLLVESAFLPMRVRFFDRELRGSSSFERREEARQRHKALKGWFWSAGAALILVSAFGFISSLNFASWHHVDVGQVTVQLSDQSMRDLAGLLEHSAVPPSPGPQDGKDTLTLDPALSAAMLKYFRGAAAAPKIGLSWNMLIIILLAAALITIWYAVSKKPEVTPVAAALTVLATVAAVIEKLVGDGSALPLGHVPGLVLTLSCFLVLGGMILVWPGAWCLFFKGGNGGLLPIKDRALDAVAAVVFGISIALLGVLPLLLFHGGHEVAGNHTCSACQQPPVVPAPEKLSIDRLSSLTNLGDGDGPGGEEVRPELIQGLRGGSSEAQRSTRRFAIALRFVGLRSHAATWEVEGQRGTGRASRGMGQKGS
jgi:hypothetical protein